MARNIEHSESETRRGDIASNVSNGVSMARIMVAAMIVAA